MSITSGSGGPFVAPPGPIPPQVGYTPSLPFINGAQTFLSLVIPNDGKPHAVALSVGVNITSIQTGGGVNINYNAFGAPQVRTQVAGSLGTGYVGGGSVIVVDPGQTITATQAAAQSAGAGTVQVTLTLLS